MEGDNVQVMDVRGLSFKRFLEIAAITGAKVAVVTDNDYQKNCIDKYSDFANIDNINIFYESDNSKRTFEIVLEDRNKQLCEDLFGNTAVDYMVSA